MDAIDAEHLGEILTAAHRCAPADTADEIAEDELWDRFTDSSDRHAIRNVVRHAYHAGRADEFCAQNAITPEERSTIAELAGEQDKLRKQGLTVLEFRVGVSRWDVKDPQGAIEILKGAAWGDELDFDPVRHAKEPCHAVAVHPRTLDVHVFCTNRKNHPNAKTGDEKRQTRSAQSDERWKAHEKEMRQARETRRAFVGELLGRKITNANELILAAFLDRAEAEARKVACQLLGLEARHVTKPYKHDDYDTPLREHAAKSASNGTKVGLALAFAGAEIRARAGWSTWGEIEKRYFAFLEQHGYTPSPAEKREDLRQAPVAEGLLMPRRIWKGRDRLTSGQAEELQRQAAELAAALDDPRRVLHEMQITRRPEAMRRAA